MERMATKMKILLAIIIGSISVSSCSKTVPDRPANGKAPASAYEMGRQLSFEIASRQYPEPDDPRWLERAVKHSDLEAGLAAITAEVGGFRSMGPTTCLDAVPVDTQDYPYRVLCSTIIKNECKDSTVRVVIASENNAWSDTEWGLLAVAVGRNPMAPSTCH